MKRMSIVLIISIAAVLFGCSSHIENLIVRPVDVDVEIDFKTLILGYDANTNIATATGLGDGASYSWFMDGDENSPVFKTKNGANCELDITKIPVGIHTLLVVGTLNGVPYSSDCKITITSE